MTGLARPKGFAELVAHLDACGWSYGVRWTTPDKTNLKLTVTGTPPWDEILRIEVSWLSQDGGPLNRSSVMTRQRYQGESHRQSMKAVHAFIAPEHQEGTP